MSSSMPAEEPVIRYSVIVPCRNERNYIRPFLESLLRQDALGPEWEVVIADGMSDDGTRDVLREYERRSGCIRVIDNPRKITPAALNAAIHASRGEIIIRMDVHAEYAADFLRRCVDVLEETGADNVGGAPRVCGKSLRSQIFSAAFHSPFAVGGAKTHAVHHEGYVDTVFPGCWRKSTLLKAGLFDETLIRNQDDEINLRLTRMGGKIWQSPKIVCWYHPRSTLRGLFRQYFQYGFWKVAVIRKHRFPASWRHLAPGAFVLAQLFLPLVALTMLLGGYSQAVNLPLSAWMALTGTYAVACVTAAVAAGSTHGWRVIPFLPFVFMTYHVAYGLGFLAGVVCWLPGNPRAMAQSGVFTHLTR